MEEEENESIGESSVLSETTETRTGSGGPMFDVRASPVNSPTHQATPMTREELMVQELEEHFNLPPEARQIRPDHY